MPSACYAYGDSTIILIYFQQSVLLATYGSLSADAKVWPETSVLVGYTGPVRRFAPKPPREIDTVGVANAYTYLSTPRLFEDFTCMTFVRSLTKRIGDPKAIPARGLAGQITQRSTQHPVILADHTFIVC